jgi:GT2 family glycosyltransferase
MLMPPIWFEAIVRALVRGGERSVITGQVLVSANKNEEGFAPSIKADKHSITYEGRVGKDILYTGNMAIHRSAMEQIGLFDERLGPGTAYPAAEDNDLGFRLLEAGYRIIYEPAAVLYHRTWRSKKESVQLDWNYGRGQGAFYAKYFSLRDTYMMRRMAKNVVKYLVHLPKHLMFDRVQAQKSLLFLAGLASGVLHWSIDQRRGKS